MPYPVYILEEGLFQFLLANSDITNMVGPNGIYLGAVPQTTHDPCMGIDLISATPDATNDGPSGFNSRRYQFTFYSQSFANAVKLRELLRTVLDGFTGTLPNGQRVFDVRRDNELNGFDDLTGSHRAITDYFIDFLE
jgi:hypothetical protein